MLFRRRKPLTLSQRIGRALWPERGWSRAMRYYGKRLLRLSGSPHSIAAGFATGVAMSMTPFIGFHYLLTIVVAFLVRGNIVAAVLGTSLGNPITYPFTWVITYEIGNLFLQMIGRGRESMNFDAIRHHLTHDSWSSIWPIFEPMLVGAVPMAILCGAIAYAVVFWASMGFQNSRRERFAIRRRSLHGNG